MKLLKSWMCQIYYHECMVSLWSGCESKYSSCAVFLNGCHCLRLCVLSSAIAVKINHCLFLYSTVKPLNLFDIHTYVRISHAMINNGNSCMMSYQLPHFKFRTLQTIANSEFLNLISVPSLMIELHVCSRPSSYRGPMTLRSPFLQDHFTPSYFFTSLYPKNMPKNTCWRVAKNISWFSNTNACFNIS